jgi:hypothetical protein
MADHKAGFFNAHTFYGNNGPLVADFTSIGGSITPLSGAGRTGGATPAFGALFIGIRRADTNESAYIYDGAEMIYLQPPVPTSTGFHNSHQIVWSATYNSGGGPNDYHFIDWKFTAAPLDNAGNHVFVLTSTVDGFFPGNRQMWDDNYTYLRKPVGKPAINPPSALLVGNPDLAAWTPGYLFNNLRWQPTSPSLLVYDNFNSPDNTLMNARRAVIGLDWTDFIGTAKIVGKKMVANVQGTGNWAGKYAPIIDVGSPDYSITMSITVDDEGDGGCFVRATDSDNLFLVNLNVGNTHQLIIYRVVAGVFTPLIADTTTSFSAGPHIMLVECSGNRITATVDDTHQVTCVDSFHNTGTLCGPVIGTGINAPGTCQYFSVKG